MSGALREVRARLGLRVLGQCADGEGRDSEVHPRSPTFAQYLRGPHVRSTGAEQLVGHAAQKGGTQSKWTQHRSRSKRGGALRRSDTQLGPAVERTNSAAIGDPRGVQRAAAGPCGSDARLEGGWGGGDGMGGERAAQPSRDTERRRLWAAKAAREHTGVCKDGQRNAVGSVDLRRARWLRGRGLSRRERAVTKGTCDARAARVPEPREFELRRHALAAASPAPPSRAGCPSNSPSCCRARAASWLGGT